MVSLFAAVGGSSELMLRLPGALLGVALVALVYRFGRDLGGPLVATLAALLGRTLSKRVALCSLLGGTLSSLAWRIFQPWHIDALFIGLGGSLLTTLLAAQIERRFR